MGLKTIFLFVLITLLVGQTQIIAQTTALDSLQELLAKEQDEIKKIDLLNQLFNEQYPTDYKKALQYATLALKKAKAVSGDDKRIKNRISESANNVGIAYLLLANYEKSMKYLLMALKTAESVQDTNRMSNALYNLSSLYDRKSNQERANYYLEQAIKLDELQGDLISAADGYSTIAANYFFSSDYDKGMKYYEKAMNIFKPLNDLESMSILYGNRAVGLKNIKKYEEALKSHQLAIAIKLKLNDKAGLETAYLNMADLYIKMKLNDKAITYNLKSLELAQELNSTKNIMLAYSGLAETYQQMGNKDKALEYLQLYVNWKDTLYNQENAEAIAEMATKYETEKKETENNLLKTEQALDKAEIEKKSTQQHMLMLGLGLALIIVVYVAYSLNQKKKTNKILNNQKTIIEEKNKDITDSINYAKKIQNAILPPVSILQNNFESFIYYKPKDIVSGDFYWLKEVGNKIYFSVVDCTGHGVPGAFMSIIGYNSLNKIVEDLKIEKTGAILDELNKQVNKVLGMQMHEELSIRDGMDISICCIDKEKNILEYSGANNSLYILKKQQKSLEDLETIMEKEDTVFYEIKPNKMAIGDGDNKKSYQTHTLPLHKKDTVYLFSDGYADQFGGPKGKKFMYKPFKKLLLSLQDKKMENQRSALNQTIVDWMGELDQLDDICIMGVRI